MRFVEGMEHIGALRICLVLLILSMTIVYIWLRHREKDPDKYLVEDARNLLVRAIDYWDRKAHLAHLDHDSILHARKKCDTYKKELQLIDKKSGLSHSSLLGYAAVWCGLSRCGCELEDQDDFLFHHT